MDGVKRIVENMVGEYHEDYEEGIGHQRKYKHQKENRMKCE